jgi:hypothetical protein
MRFQSATESLDANLHHFIRTMDKTGLNGLIDYASIFRLEIDRHGCLSVLRVTLHAADRCPCCTSPAYRLSIGHSHFAATAAMKF